MNIIGVTGGAGCGKSTVCEALSLHPNTITFDADAQVREFMAQDKQVRQEVAELLNKPFYTDSAEERSQLRENAFVDDALRLALEDILHPRVKSALIRLAEEHQNSQSYLIAEIPLLYEASFVECFSLVVVVAASEQTQYERLLHRRWSRTLIDRVLLIQWPMAKKTALADFVVWNDGNRAILEKQMLLLLERIF